MKDVVMGLRWQKRQSAPKFLKKKNVKVEVTDIPEPKPGEVYKYSGYSYTVEKVGKRKLLEIGSEIVVYTHTMIEYDIFNGFGNGALEKVSYQHRVVYTLNDFTKMVRKKIMVKVK